MRSWQPQRIIAPLTVGAGLVWVVYHWVIVDGGIEYFAEDSRHILHLIVCIVVGTPLLLGFVSMREQVRRKVELWLVGLMALGVTCVSLQIGYSTLRMARFLFESGDLMWGILAALIPSVMAVCLWIMFYRLRLRKGAGSPRITSPLESNSP